MSGIERLQLVGERRHMSDLSLVPLRTACVPRDDVLQGGLADNHFAAQLDKVVRDAEHYPVMVRCGWLAERVVSARHGFSMSCGSSQTPA